MRCPKSRFPIRFIVFDKLKLIIFVSQGLTLSTASLVIGQELDSELAVDLTLWCIIGSIIGYFNWLIFEI